jgi:hypothetical protein
LEYFKWKTYVELTKEDSGEDEKEEEF